MFDCQIEIEKKNPSVKHFVTDDWKHKNVGILWYSLKYR